HDRGIVHRDLKPANVKVRPDGTGKVLDFGLAKLVDARAKSASGPDAAHAPTTTGPAQSTGLGIVLGTAAYMAPEQARGEDAGRPADLWAFGCVLFEMLIGTPPFRVSSVAELIGEVLKADPDWTRLPVDTPPNVQRLLRRCLVKDPRRRLQHFGDARLDLTDVEPAPSASSASRPGKFPGAGVAWLAAAVAAAAASALAFRPVPMRAPAPVRA
ncbi:MAG: serine/threonine-protein kinase, partial [Vicinamibacterales bacterium]